MGSAFKRKRPLNPNFLRELFGDRNKNRRESQLIPYPADASSRPRTQNSRPKPDDESATTKAKLDGRLYKVAEDQQGLFTTKQTKAAGFAENTHPYHVQAGVI